MEIDYEQRNKDLQELINRDWKDKVGLTIAKLMEFYVRTKGNCYLSCSGGADSIVLYDICKKVEQMNGWKFKVVFSDTGLEEPTVRATALAIPEITVVRPEMSFLEVLSKKGYPIVSKEVSECVNNARKHLTGGGTTDTSNKSVDWKNLPQRVQKILGKLADKRGIPDKSRFNRQKYKPLINAPFRISNECCNIMKKKPLSKIEEKPIIATMTEESENRKTAWLKTGCNSFEGKVASRPMSFWTKQDVLNYVKYYNIKVADCYGEVIPVDKDNKPTFEETKDHYMFSGVQRTGCIYCMFGSHLDTQKGGISRFELLRRTQPQLFDYCMKGGKFDAEGLWIPHNGLGMAFVIEWLNRNLSKTLKDGSVSKFMKGIDLSNYKEQIDKAFEELEKIEDTRKKWL